MSMLRGRPPGLVGGIRGSKRRNWSFHLNPAGPDQGPAEWECDGQGAQAAFMGRKGPCV